MNQSDAGLTYAESSPRRFLRTLHHSLAKAKEGVPLNAAEAETLLQARGDQLHELMSCAARLRNEGLRALERPRSITYSRKVFVPLTHLCRNRCGYCAFAEQPSEGSTPFLSPDSVLRIAEAGARAGCKEALFTLGDRPESRWPEARQWLDQAGYSSTLDYLRAMSNLVLEHTGLLPHLNPGVMSREELQQLKPAAVSMGLMIESSSTRLVMEQSGPHYGSPDKVPSVRVHVLEDAGWSRIPFTTGILVGIGETRAERVDAILTIGRAAAFGGIQEVIVQRFRAKPLTPMQHIADLSLDEYLATLAVTRLLLGPHTRVQAPANLVALPQVRHLVAAGVDDFGGVSPVTVDHVNPERPWPNLHRLAAVVAAAGFTLTERLALYPVYQCEPWLDARLVPLVASLAGPDGLARRDASTTTIPALRGKRWTHETPTSSQKP